jgi:sodium transport system permease protein
MKGTKIVMQKELARVFGDKKLVFSLFILPAVLMIGIYSLMGNMISQMTSDIEEHIPVMYIQNQPEGFDAFVESMGFKGDIKKLDSTDSIDGLKDDIKIGKIDLVVSFQDDFLTMIQNYKVGDPIPEVKTYYNPSEDYSSQARETFVSSVLTSYQQQLLAARVGNLESLTIFNIDLDSNTSMIMDEDKANGKMLAMMLPYLIVMLLFTGPMSLGVDAITGEKERGTMASMLITPLKRSEIVMGKLLSLSILSCLSAVVYAGSMMIAMPLMYKGISDEAGMGASASLSVVQMLELLMVMLVLVYLYVAIVSLIAVFAKTAKEAGTYISPVYIVVIVAGILTMFSGNTEMSLGMYGIPVYGGAACIQKIMTNELNVAQFGINIIGTLAVAFIITYFITKAFNSEKVMFNA